MTANLTERLGCRELHLIRPRWRGLSSGMGRALAAAEMLIDPALTHSVIAMPYREPGDLLAALTLASRLDVQLCIVGAATPEVNLRCLLGAPDRAQQEEGATLARDLPPLPADEARDAACCLGGLLSLRPFLQGRALYLLL